MGGVRVVRLGGMRVVRLGGVVVGFGGVRGVGVVMRLGGVRVLRGVVSRRVRVLRGEARRRIRREARHGGSGGVGSGGSDSYERSGGDSQHWDSLYTGRWSDGAHLRQRRGRRERTWRGASSLRMRVERGVERRERMLFDEVCRTESSRGRYWGEMTGDREGFYTHTSIRSAL